MNRNELKQIISKDYFNSLYVDQDLSLQEIVDILNNKDITVSSLRHLNAEEYKCHKDRKKVTDRIKKQNLEKYGVENIFSLNEIKNKIKQTNLEKYGVENPFGNKSIQEKIKQTNLEKYGVENPLQSEEIQNRVRATNMCKYGKNNPAQNDDIKNKIKQTNLKRYGTITPAQNDDIKNKIKQTNLERYGNVCSLHNNEIQNKVKQTNYEKYGNEYYQKTEDFKNKSIKTNLEKYGVSWFCMTDKCKNSSGSCDSKPNLNFANILNELHIPYEREFNIDNRSFDFKINNILIEIDPTITHNSTFGIHSKNGIAKNYHYEKTILARKNNFNCIHIFDWDNIDLILNYIREDKTRIYARKCDIKTLQAKEVNTFLINNHYQGTCNGQTICFGLFYENELVEVMTFGKPRYNKKYEYELLRLCTKKDLIVIGGAERLFSVFITQYQPKSIISYCDNSKFTGRVYEKLGFKLFTYGDPSKHWFNMKTHQHITDNLLRQKGYDILFGTSYGKGTSNEELMIKNNFVEIYDCGQSVFEYIK